MPGANAVLIHAVPTPAVGLSGDVVTLITPLRRKRAEAPRLKFLLPHRMDPTVVGFCTRPSGERVLYLLREGLPPWSLEARRQESRASAPAEVSPAGAPEPQSSDGGGAPPDEVVPQACSGDAASAGGTAGVASAIQL